MQDRGDALAALSKRLESTVKNLPVGDVAKTCAGITASLDKLPADQHLASRITQPMASLVSSVNIATKHHVANIGTRFADHTARRVANDQKNEAAMTELTNIKAELQANEAEPDDGIYSQNKQALLNRAAPVMAQIKECKATLEGLGTELDGLKAARDMGVVAELNPSLNGLTSLLNKSGMQTKETMHAVMEKSLGKGSTGQSVMWAGTAIPQAMRQSAQGVESSRQEAVAVFKDLAQHAKGRHGVPEINNPGDPAWGPWIANQEIKATLTHHGVGDDAIPADLKALLSDLEKVPTKSQPGHAEYMQKLDAEGG